MRLLRAILAAVILLAVVPPPARADDPKDEIRAVLSRYSDATKRGDAVALEGLFAEDVILMPAESPRFEGRKAAMGFWAQAHALKLARIVQSIEVSGDLAWAAGVYSHRRTFVTSVPSSNNFLTTLRREADGSWRVVRDIWNGAESGLLPAH